MNYARFIGFSFAAFSMCAGAGTDDPCATGLPWYMVKSPTSGESSVYLVLNSKSPVNARICYCDGKEGTYVWVRANDATEKSQKQILRMPELTDSQRLQLLGGTWVSQLYQSSCTIAGGTDIWLANPNAEPAKGRFEVLK